MVAASLQGPISCKWAVVAGELELPPGPLTYAGPSGIDMVSSDRYGWALGQGSGCGVLGYGSGSRCCGHGNHCYRSGGCGWLSRSSGVVNLMRSGVVIGSHGWIDSWCSGHGAEWWSGLLGVGPGPVAVVAAVARGPVVAVAGSAFSAECRSVLMQGRTGAVGPSAAACGAGTIVVLTGHNLSGIASHFAMHFSLACDAFPPMFCNKCDA